MKFFFFGQERKSGTTSNMVAVATRLSVKEQKKIILLQLGDKKETLETAFYKSWENQRLRENCAYFLAEGLDYLLQKNTVKLEEIQKVLKEFIPGVLYYFPMGEREIILQNPRQYRIFLGRVVEKLEQMADYVFIDCGALEIKEIEFLKKKEDLTVINLKQTSESFDAFFLKQYHAAQKFFYLVGNYHFDSVYNKKNLYRMYRIPQGRFGVIPYNPQFQYACQRGQLWRYLSDSHSLLPDLERDKAFRRETDQVLAAMLEETKYETEKFELYHPEGSVI